MNMRVARIHRCLSGPGPNALRKVLAAAEAAARFRRVPEITSTLSKMRSFAPPAWGVDLALIIKKKKSARNRRTGAYQRSTVFCLLWPFQHPLG